MRKILLIHILLLICTLAYSQNVMEKVIEIPWDTEQGCKTKQISGDNHGIADFVVLNDKELAVLCDIEFKVKIFNLETKKLASSFSFDKTSHYYLMAYIPSKQLFYLFDGISILCYTRAGELVDRIQIARQVLDVGATKLYSQGENLYITNGDFTSTIIEKGRVLSQSEQANSGVNGIVGHNGEYYTITKRGDDFVVTSTKSNWRDATITKGIDYEGDLWFINGNDDILVFTLVYVISINPTRIRRQILIYSLTTNEITERFDVPNIYFTIMHNSFQFNGDHLYHFLTTPKNAVLLRSSVVPCKSKGVIYPDEYDYEFHYNTHIKKK